MHGMFDIKTQLELGYIYITTHIKHFLDSVHTTKLYKGNKHLLTYCIPQS